MNPGAVLLAVSGLSLALALLLTPIVRDAFLNLRIVDSPDGRRKLHLNAVPPVGGISIVFSYAASFLACYLFPDDWGLTPAGGHDMLIVRLIFAASVVFVTGLLDDVVGLRPWQKLLGLALGAGVACAGGVRISSMGGQPWGDWLALPLTAVWLLACSNAFNLIDGLDGLATGTGLFATVTAFVAALLHGNEALALATLPFAGALLGFLRYNVTPASVFLGDGGSLLIGFLLGCYGVIWSQEASTPLGVTAPLLALGLPLLEVGLTIARRWLRSDPIFGADRSHIHHKLLERGLSQGRVVVILYAAVGLCAAVSLVQTMAQTPFAGLIMVLFCAATWATIQRLGYPEFGGARRALRPGVLRRMLAGEVVLHTFESKLRSADSVEECWTAVKETSRELGFSLIEARFHQRHFTEPLSCSQPTACWQLRVPLDGAGYLHVLRDLHATMQPAVLASFIELVHRRFAPRLRELPNPADTREVVPRYPGPPVSRGRNGEPAPASP